jgi:hypothetical protein
MEEANIDFSKPPNHRDGNQNGHLKEIITTLTPIAGAKKSEQEFQSEQTFVQVSPLISNTEDKPHCYHSQFQYVFTVLKSPIEQMVCALECPEA